MDAKTAAHSRVDDVRDDLVELSRDLHDHPEVGFEEHRSSRRVADDLAKRGFAVEHGVSGLDTAFVATAGSGPLHVGICAEYDALPGIGHACGHNLISGSAVGAGIALAEVADDLGLTVRVLGTPAEEGGGGKIIMLEQGAFDGLHLAMMVHPAARERPAMGCLAVQHFEVRYTGKSAHASAHPEEGINAADALTVAQVAVGLLRQHLRGTDRIHGIVTDGGDAPNIVPERTAGQWYARAANLAELSELYPRVRRCFEAGAIATGASLEFDEPGAAYSEFDHDATLVDLYRSNAETLGREFPDEDAETSRQVGSTDMANVSLVMPAIHPMLSIESLPAVNHQPEFTAATLRAPAQQAMVDGAKAMAGAVVDLAEDDELRQRYEAETFRAADATFPWNEHDLG
ncbi:MAG: M20 family metallopeptidase [Nitriliruptorales bacterium]|nr:M20 family metallopeptidase [Nitriliruptorales bacterium]